MADLLGGILSDVGLGDLIPSSTPTPASTRNPVSQHVTSSAFTPTSVSTSTPTPESLSPSSISTESSPTTSSTISTSSSTSANTTSSDPATSTQTNPSTRTSVPTATVTASSTPDQGGSSNTGAIAAGVIACIAIVGILIAAVVWIFKRKQKAKRLSRRETKEFRQLDDSGTGGGAMSKEIGIGRGEATSPQTPFSPDSFSRVEKLELKPIVYELPDTSVRAEMDSGQRYHAYRPAQ